MAAISTLRQMLNRADTPPANDVTNYALRSQEMTLDDLEATLENARQRVERAGLELEQRMADLAELERAFVDRINPQLHQHKIIPLTEEEMAEREEGA